MLHGYARVLCIGIGTGLVCVCCAFNGYGAEDLAITAGPYLQYPTETSMTVCWETNQAATTEAGWGKTAEPLTWVSGPEREQFHHVRLEGLEPAGHYFYQIRSRADGHSRVESAMYTFQTAVGADAPFSFVVISDTQDNAMAVSKLAESAYSQRPQFTLLPGDFVSFGTKKELWNDHFFRNMQVLNTRVPLIPCLGNHDKDSRYYYEYFAVPAPKYCYSFPYGNMTLFIVDSERSLEPGSEQYQWLDTALGGCTSTWKIVCLHKAAYSSDQNDFGDTAVEQSSFGDVKLRATSALYEQHHVDIVWCGHVHSYERTYPMIQGKPVIEGGVVYMVTGGGGGGLEKAAPWRGPFTAKVYSGHHYCLVNVFGPTLRIEAYSPAGYLFDYVEMRKAQQ